MTFRISYGTGNKDPVFICIYTLVLPHNSHDVLFPLNKQNGNGHPRFSSSSYIELCVNTMITSTGKVTCLDYIICFKIKQHVDEDLSWYFNRIRRAYLQSYTFVITLAYFTLKQRNDQDVRIIVMLVFFLFEITIQYE